MYQSKKISLPDLLMSLSNGRRSVSDEGISHWIDATDEELGEEVCIIFSSITYYSKKS